MENATMTLRYDEAFVLAVQLHQSGRLAESEKILRQLVAECAPNAEMLGKLGCVLVDARKPAEAIPFLEASLRLNPDFAETHNNLGAALMSLKRLDESEAAFARSVELWPEFVHAHDNLGNARYRLQKFALAEQAFRRALELEPTRGTALLGMGMSLLIQGKYAEGWQHYLGRVNLPPSHAKSCRPPVPTPLWEGQSLKGKSILVWREQGFGDELMCVRYAAILRDMGASRVTWVCAPALREVFRRVKGITDIFTEAEKDKIPPHDYCAPALNLPGYCGTTVATIPAALPYLSTDAKSLKYWKKCLTGPELKVGLVWKGDSVHMNNANRSLASLSMLAPLWKTPGVRFVSLQKGDGADEAARPPADQPLTHLGGGLLTFADTVAIVSHLDLVITVDTAVAHVAGALGKPVWVMTPFELIDWRWLDGRDDTPWYPGVMRLFRQGKGEPWSVVIDRVAEALAKWRHSA